VDVIGLKVHTASTPALADPKYLVKIVPMRGVYVALGVVEGIFESFDRKIPPLGYRNAQAA
jgi:hypothetical protein